VKCIIEGRQISKMLEESDPLVVDNYCKILQRASSVIFCRSSPKEKALIVKYVKRHLGFVVLGIGDGGNDVGMIEEAQIGVGIIGK
jgi:phospholipid-translocating ATPase